mmetsp:Transcript_29292/g.66408  ORF Transcript_29292/g.66408 Transcript_29292/m.66408 type:complete len:245 (+) Transcript_29292:1109-1843(+)
MLHKCRQVLAEQRCREADHQGRCDAGGRGRGRRHHLPDHCPHLPHWGPILSRQVPAVPPHGQGQAGNRQGDETERLPCHRRGRSHHYHRAVQLGDHVGPHSPRWRRRHHAREDASVDVGGQHWDDRHGTACLPCYIHTRCRAHRPLPPLLQHHWHPHLVPSPPDEEDTPRCSAAPRAVCIILPLRTARLHPCGLCFDPGHLSGRRLHLRRQHRGWYRGLAPPDRLPGRLRVLVAAHGRLLQGAV